ncbi:GNAT domain containing protein [uncultured Caudovirales phage]|uniref:GNAT domain containing protein n=1 Tax=uncultured Caudovirales phage TaxID=2100421 RepID=A0A6J5ND71_9CAUD|nr:GNAT domain containing protein [uncultured Caudovirales phage]
MKIIEANKFHSSIIYEMLTHYREVTPIEFLKHCDNEYYINKLLAHIFAGRGVALLAYHDDKPIGMLLGLIEQSIWDPDICIMKELAYWVEPDSRGTSAGYRLLSKYNEVAQSLSDMGRIKTWTISKMVNSPDLNYGKLGFRKIEETWSMN